MEEMVSQTMMMTPLLQSSGKVRTNSMRQIQLDRREDTNKHWEETNQLTRRELEKIDQKIMISEIDSILKLMMVNDIILIYIGYFLKTIFLMKLRR